MGRPTKLNAETRKRILDELKGGQPLRVAAARAGVHPTTVSRWRSSDPELAREMTIATLLGEGDLVDLARAGETSAQWMLERRWPRSWSARFVISMEREAEELMAILRETLPDDMLAIVLERLTDHELGLRSTEDPEPAGASVSGRSGEE